MRKIVRKSRAALKMKRKGLKRRPMMRRGAKGIKSSDYAKCVETTETKLIAVSDANGDSTGSFINFCLQDYQRAQEIAHAYKYYRASKVEVTFIPYFNVAQTGGANNTQLPQMYMAVDRVSNRFIPVTETECLERGMRPRLLNKKLRIAFKPNLLQGISLETRQPADGQGVPQGIDLAGYQNSVPLFNKWLPTQQSFGYGIAANPQVNQVLAPLGVNPYALKYYGLVYNPAVEGLAPNTNLIVGDYQVRITWEFKGPRALKTLLPNPETNTYVATSSQGNPTGAIPNQQPTTYP